MPNPGGYDGVWMNSELDITHLDLGMEFRGGQRQVVYLAGAQLRSGLNVRVAAPRGAPLLAHARRAGLPVWVLPGRYDFDLRSLWSVCRRLPHLAVVHTHDSRSASLGALVRCFRRDCVLLHSRRVSYPPGQGWSRWKYRLGQAVVCVSRDIETCMKKAGVSHTYVVHSTIDRARYAPRPEQGNGGRVGIIGALSPQKGHAVLFAALSRMRDVPEVWVVGDGRLEQSLRAEAAAFGLGERVVWKGHVESPDVLPALDVLVVPSVHGEGSSGVIKEGWAAGVPVLCSDLPANRELVRDEDNGLLFRNKDAQALAVQLRRLLDDADLGERLARQARRDLEEYSVENMHAAYLRIYAQVVMSAGGRHASR